MLPAWIEHRREELMSHPETDDTGAVDAAATLVLLHGRGHSPASMRSLPSASS
jgi:hypothetical protein